MIKVQPVRRFDIASATDMGARAYQEDKLIVDFPEPGDSGIVVLADGMGGHAAGDVASDIAVREVISTLKSNGDPLFRDMSKVPERMAEAIETANASIARASQENRKASGMGSTVIAAIFSGNQMHWSSVGDSPLLHYRGGDIVQVNEDHSMAPEIDAMAAAGLIGLAEATTHPQRNALTSALTGRAIPRIDNRGRPLELRPGDLIVIASDGLQFLDNRHIAETITRNRRKSSGDIAEALLQAVKDLDDPDQDNVSFAVVKIRREKSMLRFNRGGDDTEGQ